MQDEDGRITASFVNLSHLCLFKRKNEPLMMETPSLGIRTGLKIPSSSSSSCPCWPVLSPCSCSPEPPFSRLLGLFGLVPLAVAGPAPPSSGFPERWMSLCLCERKRRALRGERWAHRESDQRHETPSGTSLISIRPAMESLVRGEKCGVIMTRRPASEKDSLWGLRMRSSSTITAGGGSWPLAWPGRGFEFNPVCKAFKEN